MTAIVKYRQETGQVTHCDLVPPATPGSAGYDLKLRGDGPEVGWGIGAGERDLIKTGLFLEIPEGYEAQVRPRSGLALKHGLTVLNSPGTIDADYRGEIGIILINHSDEDYFFSPGDRIAQIVFQKVPSVQLVPADTLTETERGTGGFGSTGR